MTAFDATATTRRYGYLLAVAGGMASRLAMLAILIILPSRIGLTEYGLFVLVVTIGEIVEMTSSNWYRILLVRQGVNEPDLTRAEAHAERPASISMTFASVIACVTVLAILIATAIAPVFAGQAGHAFTLATIVYVAAFVAFKLLIAILQAQRRQQLIGVLELLRGVLMAGLVIGALKLDPASFLYPALALSAAAFLTAAIGIAFSGAGVRVLLRGLVTRKAFAHIGLPVIIMAALTFQLGWIDRLIIQSFIGVEQVGLYVAVAAIARQPIDLVLNAMNTQTFPVMMEKSELAQRNARQRASSILVSACILGVGGAAAIIALANPLVRTILPAFDAAQAAALVAPIALGSVFLGLKSFTFDNVFHAHGKNWIMLKSFAAVAMATLVASVIAIAFYGVIGAAIAFVVGSGFALLASAIVSRRIWTFQIPVMAIVKVIVSAALAAFAAFAIVDHAKAPHWFELALGLTGFASAYLLCLAALLRFNPRRFLSAPWELEFATGATR